MVDFEGYACFDPGVDSPLDEVSRKEARAHYDLFIGQRKERISQLGALVARDGISMDGDDESILQLNGWFFQNVEPDSTGEYTLRPIWYSVVNDIAIYLCEELIRRAPWLHWEFYTYGKKDISYQRPVIMGFNVKNKRYNVDFDHMIGTYAHRVVRGKEDERDFFMKIMKSALDFA